LSDETPTVDTISQAIHRVETLLDDGERYLAANHVATGIGDVAMDVGIYTAKVRLAIEASEPALDLVRRSLEGTSQTGPDMRDAMRRFEIVMIRIDAQLNAVDLLQSGLNRRIEDLDGKTSSAETPRRLN
jgi:hypothetical protein